MKKTVIILAIITTLFCLSACGNSENEKAKGSGSKHKTKSKVENSAKDTINDEIIDSFMNGHTFGETKEDTKKIGKEGFTVWDVTSDSTFFSYNKKTDGLKEIKYKFKNATKEDFNTIKNYIIDVCGDPYRETGTNSKSIRWEINGIEIRLKLSDELMTLEISN